MAGKNIGSRVRENVRRIEDLVLQTGLDNSGKPRLALIRHSVTVHPFSRRIGPKTQESACIDHERLAR